MLLPAYGAGCQAVGKRAGSAIKLLPRPANAPFRELAFPLALPQVSHGRRAGALDPRAIQLKAFALVAGLDLELLDPFPRSHEVIDPGRQRT